MKIQQRNFIVEIKSNGRRSAIRQGSIWGSTDLKALARQAASVAPQLFDDTSDTTSIVNADDVPLSTTQSGTIEASCATGDGLELQIASVADQPIQNAVENSVAVSGSHAAKRKPAIATKRTKKIVLEQSAHDIRNDTPVAAEPIDELSVLEVENRDLKTQFARYLRKQNRQLLQMLKRFDVS